MSATSASKPHGVARPDNWQAPPSADAFHTAPRRARSRRMRLARRIAWNLLPPLTFVAMVGLWWAAVVVFRIPVGPVSPAERAAGAARRFDALPDDVRPEEIVADPAAIGDLRGLLVRAHDMVLFGIAEGDLDPTTGESLAEVGQRAVRRLREVMEARVQQRRPTVFLLFRDAAITGR